MVDNQTPKPQPQLTPLGWTTEQWEYFKGYTRHLANELGLRDWLFNMKFLPPTEEDSAAEIKIVHGRRVADIRICEDYLTQDSASQREYIIHELLHCHLEPIMQVVRTTENGLGSPTFLIVNHLTVLAIENAVDAIAIAIAPRFPPCLINVPAALDPMPPLP